MASSSFGDGIFSMLLQPVLFVENPTTDNDPKVSNYERANQLTSRPNGVSRTATTVAKTQAGTDRALERRTSALAFIANRAELQADSA
jgi:hypothetical protein